MFICLFVCLFVCWTVFFISIILGHPQEYALKISRGPDLILLRYSGSKTVYLFVCLLICLFFFILIILGHPENFVRIQLDLAEILFNVYLFVCLFVCLLTCLFFILIILEHPQEYTLKISWRLDLIWLRYIGF